MPRQKRSLIEKEEDRATAEILDTPNTTEDVVKIKNKIRSGEQIQIRFMINDNRNLYKK